MSFSSHALNLFYSLFAVREVRFHPFDILLRRDFAVVAFVTLGDRLIAPLIEFVLFQLMNSYSGGVALVVFVVDRNRFVVGDFCLVVLQSGKLLAGSGFALGYAVAIVRVVIALHNKVFAAALITVSPI